MKYVRLLVVFSLFLSGCSVFRSSHSKNKPPEQPAYVIKIPEFSELDKNGDGTITSAEFSSAEPVVVEKEKEKKRKASYLVFGVMVALIFLICAFSGLKYRETWGKTKKLLASLKIKIKNTFKKSKSELKEKES